MATHLTSSLALGGALAEEDVVRDAPCVIGQNLEEALKDGVALVVREVCTEATTTILSKQSLSRRACWVAHATDLNILRNHHQCMRDNAFACPWQRLDYCALRCMQQVQA